MKHIVAGHVAVTAVEFAELALGTPPELWLGVEGESEVERAARLDAAHDILSDPDFATLPDDLVRLAARVIEEHPELFDVVPLARRRAMRRGGRGMNGAMTLDGLAAPLRAVRLLALDYAELPAPTIGVSAIYPERLELSLHNSPADFEAWREVLGITPDGVTYREFDGYVSMSASVEYAGALLKLIGYADLSDAAPAGAPV